MAGDQLLGKLPEDVVVRHPPPFLGLDPLRSQAVPASPLFEDRPQPDHVQERAPHLHPATGRGAVEVVEVAVERDATGLREGDRPADLTAFEESLVQGIQEPGSTSG